MMQTYPTAADLDRMQAARIRRTKEQMKEARTEEYKKRLAARIWRMQNS